MTDNLLTGHLDHTEDSLPAASQLDTSLFSMEENDSDTGDEEKETYYFESDHVALKGNPDYHAMLRTIALLEAQRIQVSLNLSYCLIFFF